MHIMQAQRFRTSSYLLQHRKDIRVPTSMIHKLFSEALAKGWMGDLKDLMANCSLQVAKLLNPSHLIARVQGGIEVIRAIYGTFVAF